MERQKPIVQNTIVFLVAVLLMVGVLEGLLRIADPLGIHRLVGTLQAVSRQLDTTDPRGFGLPPGRYTLPGWSLTIDDNRNRVTPATRAGDCRIVFVGDSVTIGQSVEDDEVWVNLLADEADAEFVNAGFMGFNVYHVANTVQHRDGDGYVYLLIGNDDEAGIPFEEPSRGGARGLIQNRLLPATYAYATILRGTPSTPPAQSTTLSAIEQDEQLAAFMETFDTLVNRDDVLVIGFDHEPLSQFVAEQYPQVTLVEPFDEGISWIDRHANPAGNRQLAERVQGMVGAFVDERCAAR